MPDNEIKFTTIDGRYGKWEAAFGGYSALAERVQDQTHNGIKVRVFDPDGNEVDTAHFPASTYGFNEAKWMLRTAAEEKAN